MIEFIDKTSEQAGTPINRENLMAMQGFIKTKTYPPTKNELGEEQIIQINVETGEQLITTFKLNGQIEFKTDNRGLFEYSLVSMQNYGLKFIEVYLDLHKTDIVNIETEYEKKFSPFGPIYKIVVEY